MFKKLFSLGILLSFFNDPGHFAYASSETSSYQFTIKGIQEATRQGVMNAEEQIRGLQEKGDLLPVAYLYFKDYLGKIASYNEATPQTKDMVEAYKTELALAHTLKAFAQKYPDLIYTKSKWMFNSVGGAYANTIILYCSPREYIVIWGTSLQNYGKFSGYYPFMNEFDVMIHGKMYSHDVHLTGHLPVVYQPIQQDGIKSNTVDTSNLIPGNVRSYSLEPYTYMVSYAQGNIIKAFGPGAIMPGIFVNQDFGGLGLHIKECINSYSSSNPQWFRPFMAVKHAISSIASKLSAVIGHGDDSVKPEEVNNFRAIEIVDDYYQSAGILK